MLIDFNQKNYSLKKFSLKKKVLSKKSYFLLHCLILFTFSFNNSLVYGSEEGEAIKINDEYTKNKIYFIEKFKKETFSVDLLKFFKIFLYFLAYSQSNITKEDLSAITDPSNYEAMALFTKFKIFVVLGAIVLLNVMAFFFFFTKSSKKNTEETSSLIKKIFKGLGYLLMASGFAYFIYSVIGKKDKKYTFQVVDKDSKNPFWILSFILFFLPIPLILDLNIYPLINISVFYGLTFLKNIYIFDKISNLKNTDELHEILNNIRNMIGLLILFTLLTKYIKKILPVQLLSLYSLLLLCVLFGLNIYKNSKMEINPVNNTLQIKSTESLSYVLLCLANVFIINNILKISLKKKNKLDGFFNYIIKDKISFNQLYKLIYFVNIYEIFYNLFITQIKEYFDESLLNKSNIINNMTVFLPWKNFFLNMAIVLSKIIMFGKFILYILQFLVFNTYLIGSIMSHIYYTQETSDGIKKIINLSKKSKRKFSITFLGINLFIFIVELMMAIDIFSSKKYPEYVNFFSILCLSFVYLVISEKFYWKENFMYQMAHIILTESFQKRLNEEEVKNKIDETTKNFDLLYDNQNNPKHEPLIIDLNKYIDKKINR